MPSLKNTHKLPKPTWSGFDRQLVHRYLEFARVAQNKACRSRHKDLVEALARHEREKERQMREVGRQKDTTNSLKEQLAAAEARLLDLSDDSVIDEALQAIEELPFVIGLRPDSYGRLVVFCRLFTTDHDTEGTITGDRHVGDFELTLEVTENVHLGYGYGYCKVIPITLVTRGSGMYMWPFVNERSADETSFGRFNLQGIDSKQLMRDLRLADLVERIADRLIVESGFANPAPKEEVAEPLWSGTTLNLRGVLRRTLEQAVNSQSRTEIATLIREKEHVRLRMRAAIDRLSSLNPEISRLQAEVQEAAHLLEEEVVFDEEKAKEELRFMTSLPGVMGVKFTDEGIPVFHLRTYLELENGPFYDMGDFELTLRECGTGVVKIRMTRAPSTTTRHLYFQREGESGSGWFCFGERTHELGEIFRKGELGTFLHLALNSMNQVNRGDLFSVESKYPTIASTEVWMPHVRTRPRRRRRMVEALAGFVL